MKLSDIISKKTMQTIQQPFSNVQLELLKVFSHQLSDQEIGELRKVLAQFFARILIQRANEVWDENNWSDDDIEKMLNTKMRSK